MTPDNSAPTPERHDMPASPPREPSFATFWSGAPLSGWEAANIGSFARAGHPIYVYSYGPVEGLPPGAIPADAAEITEPGDMQRYLIRGRPNLSHFSDLFRYRLCERTPHIWVDADMVMLRPMEGAAPEALLAREDERTLCGAIMRLPQSSPQLPQLVSATLALRDRDLPWGATGPRLLTSIFGKSYVNSQSAGPARYFPVHYDEFWKVLLPAHRAECESLCSAATTLHLWNDRLVMLGIWKRFAPPAGSFLHEIYRATGLLDRFESEYPESVMQHMVYNWRVRCEGGEIGLGQWLRRMVPSARITLERRFHRAG